MTERELIEGSIKGKAACQKQLFELYSGRMMSLCLRYTNRQEDAEDVFQDGFVRVFDYMHQYRFEGSFEGWMRRIFVHVAARMMQKRKLVFTEMGDAENYIHAVEPSIVSRLSEDEIHQLIRGMPDGYRMVFNLHVIEGYSHDEIARLLGIQPSTSRVQLLKARRHLQDLIRNIQHSKT